MKPTAETPSAAGWILYDDSCGFCQRWVPFWQGPLQRRGFSIAPLQADWVRARLQMSEAELLQDLRLLLAAPVAARRLFWARFLKTLGQASWMVAALLVHAVFYKLLKVPLPWGVLSGLTW